VTTLGSEDAIHNAHWHGVVFNTSRGHHVDQVGHAEGARLTLPALLNTLQARAALPSHRSLCSLPHPGSPSPDPPPQKVTIQSGSLETLDMEADNPGTWLFHCHLSDHMDGGMMATFTVAGKAPAVTLGGKVRGAPGRPEPRLCVAGEQLGSPPVPGFSQLAPSLHLCIFPTSPLPRNAPPCSPKDPQVLHRRGAGRVGLRALRRRDVRRDAGEGARDARAFRPRVD
jgi:hypothetical protein